MNVAVRGHEGHSNLTGGCFQLGVDTDGKPLIVYDERKCAGKAFSGGFKEEQNRQPLHIYRDDKYPALCMHKMLEAEMSRRFPPGRDEDPWYVQICEQDAPRKRCQCAC
jgi:hypothetical protein